MPAPHPPVPLRPSALLVPFLVLAPAAGCGDEGPAGDDDSASGEVLTGLSDDPAVDPRAPDHAGLPWPSDYFLAADPGTASGFRVTFPDGALPATIDATTDPTPYALRDGWSPISPVLLAFPNGIEPTALPVAGDETVAEDSPVQLVDLDSGERWPYVAELDANADGQPSRQALILRPLRRLAFGHRYAVAVLDLPGQDGQPVEVSEGFRALRDGLPTDSQAIEGLRPAAESMFNRLGELGIPRENLRLAWDFRVASEAGTDSDMLDIADVVLGRTGSWEPTIDLEYRADGVLGPYRVVRGSISVPWFLDDDDHLVRDAEGHLLPQGEQRIGIRLMVPGTAAGSRPVLVFGHGLFGSDEELEDDKTNPLAWTWGLPFIATSYVGVTTIDAGRAWVAVQDWNEFVTLTDRVHQGTANFLSLARFAREELPGFVVHDDIAGTPGEPLADGTSVYTGISLGGCVGGAYMALDPGVDRGLLVVPGGGWVHMLEHSSNWDDDPASLRETFAESVPDPVDRQVLIAALSLLFDPVDQFNFVHRLVQDPWDFNTPKKVGVHMVVADSQVPNFVTEMLTRNIGLPRVVPEPYEMWGIDAVEATPEAPYQGNGALLSYKMGYEPYDMVNIPPDFDNGVHQEVRGTDAFRAQAGHFLWNDGETVQVCDGACDPD